MHHEIKILWATHSVHHHGEDFNLATALRQTSTGWLWKWIFYIHFHDPIFKFGYFLPEDAHVNLVVDVVKSFQASTKYSVAIECHN